ncbi:RES domain-containing protein [Sinorhizobium meliloti]|uniref:RES family NAD+ phosphorylase n=1 Tax=Rhizobium meliloti TaxID=382 RepID=UPI000FD8E20B|nr:RES family NAD+ phosphorylase [Sinorhizobium meliloti]RVG08842.1 RES domain-containing protein [Sinorhizobium meliloti]
MTTSIDDPAKPEFASHRSYWDNFAQRVRHERRYVWDDHVKAFVATVLATLKDRDVALKRGQIFLRAQRGIEYVAIKRNGPEEPSGYGRERMKPRRFKSTEGRANAVGVPVLYLGTSVKSVVSEVRPWIGAEISVAHFKLKRRLRALDLTRGHNKSTINYVFKALMKGEASLTPEMREDAVWIDIDNAFSKPVTLSDDAADYVPTQILAEVFRDAGYDALVYRSQFGEGANIVLFNPDDADITACAPYRVTAFEVSCEQMGNSWYKAKKKTKKTAGKNAKRGKTVPKTG